MDLILPKELSLKIWNKFLNPKIKKDKLSFRIIVLKKLNIDILKAHKRNLPAITP